MVEALTHVMNMNIYFAKGLTETVLTTLGFVITKHFCSDSDNQRG